jgi:hypothetical protein
VSQRVISEARADIPAGPRWLSHNSQSPKDFSEIMVVSTQIVSKSNKTITVVDGDRELTQHGTAEEAGNLHACRSTQSDRIVCEAYFPSPRLSVLQHLVCRHSNGD